MDRNFRIPFIIILVTVVISILSGGASVSTGVLIILIGLIILLVGKKVNWHFGRMMLLSLPLSLAALALYIGLLFLSNYIPWLNAVLLWPAG